MSRSLLAYLYPHIRGSQEDVATLSLCYLLQQSDPLRVSFTEVISRKLHVSLDEKTQYHTQASGEKKERPDLAGTDSTGRENVLCEMKFYAALTENQPNTYLDRLITEQGDGLIFICPKARQTGLWMQLLDLCKSRSVKRMDDNSAFIDGMPLAITSWLEVLDTLHETAIDKDPGILDDLHELQGFCQRMDSEEPLPFSPEDFGQDVARSIRRYQLIVDLTMEKLMSHRELDPSTQNLRATPQKYGYTRYLNISSFGADFRYDYIFWANQRGSSTPFWIRFIGRNFDHSKADEIARKLQSIPEYMKYWAGNDSPFLALIPKPYLPMDEVAADLCNQIIWYINFLNSSTEESTPKPQSED